MIRWLVVVVVFAVLLSSCAAGTNPHTDTPRESAEEPAGFWLGLWHGMIILVTFVVSLFKSSIGVYEVHNAGWSYNLGFLLGILIVYGGSSGSACRKSPGSKSE